MNNRLSNFVRLTGCFMLLVPIATIVWYILLNLTVLIGYWLNLDLPYKFTDYLHVFWSTPKSYIPAILYYLWAITSIIDNP